MGGQGKAQAAIDTPRLEGFDAKLADAVQWCSLRRGDRHWHRHPEGCNWAWAAMDGEDDQRVPRWCTCGRVDCAAACETLCPLCRRFMSSSGGRPSLHCHVLWRLPSPRNASTFTRLTLRRPRNTVAHALRILHLCSTPPSQHVQSASRRNDGAHAEHSADARNPRIPEHGSCQRVQMSLHARHTEETEEMAGWLPQIPHLQQPCHGLRYRQELYRRDILEGEQCVAGG
jgi:hypothetical protein